MRDVYIIGAFSTAFGKKPETGFKALTREAYAGLLADAGLETGAEIETGWFSNCGMGSWGQRNIRGQVCFTISLLHPDSASSQVCFMPSLFHPKSASRQVCFTLSGELYLTCA